MGSGIGHAKVVERYEGGDRDTCIDLIGRLKRLAGDSFWQLQVVLDPMWRTLLLVNLAAIMERGDEAMLPAVFNEVQIRFQVSPTSLASLTFLRAVVQACFSPIAAYLATRFNRVNVISAGVLCWAMATVAVGASRSFSQVAIARALNGIGLSVVIPSIQSIIADVYPADERGWGFGVNQMLGFFGGIGGGVLTTLMADSEFAGIPGWRMSFYVMAIASGVLASSIYFFARDPHDITASLSTYSSGDVREVELHPLALEELMSEGTRAGSDLTMVHHEDSVDEGFEWVMGFRTAWEDVLSVLRIRTFQVIVAQGIIGSFPLSALVFMTWYFELMGFSHQMVAFLMLMAGIGASIGSVFGGWAGDQMSHIFPDKGRVMCAQFCTGVSTPFSIILLRGLPRNGESWAVYACVMFVSGLLMSWNATATNNPIFSEIVPDRLRTMIYAYDRAFEVAFAAFGAPTAGILAQHLFGFQVDRVRHKSGDGVTAMSGSERLRNAESLSKSLVVCIAIPYALSCIIYSLLYWTYPVDRDHVLKLDANEEGSSQCGIEDGCAACEEGEMVEAKHGMGRERDVLLFDKHSSWTEQSLSLGGESDADRVSTSEKSDGDVFWHMRSVDRTREDLKLFAIERCRH